MKNCEWKWNDVRRVCRIVFWTQSRFDEMPPVNRRRTAVRQTDVFLCIAIIGVQLRAHTEIALTRDRRGVWRVLNWRHPRCAGGLKTFMICKGFEGPLIEASGCQIAAERAGWFRKSGVVRRAEYRGMRVPYAMQLLTKEATFLAKRAFFFANFTRWN